MKYGNIVLKISNSCWKNIKISNNTNKYIFNKKMNRLKKLLESDHGLIDAQFFHLYAKKRILAERQFIPLTDLYEFKFFIINNKIKFIYFQLYYKTKRLVFIYDKNYNFLFKDVGKNGKEEPLNITSHFSKNLLNQLKTYAIKLSEDFPNFIRVDLYLFQDKIYLSELTFASSNGIPIYKNEKFIKDSLSNFSRIDDYY